MKQIIVVRKDVQMGVGKLISQACHASLGASEKARKNCLKTWKKWMENGGKKIVVKAHSFQELQELSEKAAKLKVPTCLVIDRGLTQLPPETPTALAIGPGKDEKIDKITRDLKLL